MKFWDKPEYFLLSCIDQKHCCQLELKIMKHFIRLIILVFLFASCTQKNGNQPSFDMAGSEREMAVMSKESQISPASSHDIIEQSEVNKKKIIKDGRIGIKVRELEKAKSRIDTLVKNNGGYYANENFNNTDYEASFNLRVRIPTDKFEKFIAEVEAGDGEILYKQIDARDVTDQFIDLESRLETKRNYLTRYNELLKQAQNVKEILEIEEKIRGLEEEIESTTGRLKYLRDLVDYSSLDLMISKRKDFKYTPGERDKFTERLKQSVSKGWIGFVDFLLLMINLWPFWIIAALLFYLWKRFMRKKKIKN